MNSEPEDCTMWGEPVHVFWTGGWDSTFRVLQLLLLEKRSIQPHYIIDLSRRSTQMELKTKQKIRQALFAKYPFTADLLLPTTYMDSYAVNNPGVDIAYAKVLSTSKIGAQYRWLGGYAAASSTRLELPIEFTEAPKVGGLNYTLTPHLVTEEKTGETVLSRQLKGTSLFGVFGNFTFPLIKYTKRMMAEIAGKEGFADLMNLTWFCHKPLRGRYPCGVCIPCTTVVREGMQYRLPWWARLRRLCSVNLWVGYLRKGEL